MNEFKHGWGMDFGWLVPLLVISLLYYLFQNRKSRRQTNRSSAQDILDRRYANGGIDKKEYQEKSKQIKEQAEVS